LDTNQQIKAQYLPPTSNLDYGSFSSNNTQSVTTGGSPISYQVSGPTNGISISPVFDSRLIVSNPGIYRVSYNILLDNANAGPDVVNIWIRVNTTNVPASLRIANVTTAQQIYSGDYIVSLNGGDAVDVAIQAPLPAIISIPSTAAAGLQPAAPGCITNIVQIA
jgi:hypothetical protein